MTRSINRVTILFLIILTSSNVLAAAASTNFQIGFGAGVSTATHLNERALNAMKTLKPEETFKSFSSNPTESIYQNNPDSIRSNALNLIKTNEAAKVISGSIQHRPQENIENDLVMQVNVMSRSNGENVITPCQTGDCIQIQSQADQDFQKAISAFASSQEAAKSYTDFNSIFGGYPSSCDRVALGYINCCVDTGWGKDIHLAKCSAAEKDLAKAKQNLLTIEVGGYCNKKVLGVCVEHRKSYCVFHSKLARIIQLQGRARQLHINFGEPTAPNCKGLTRKQFARINLEKIDFSAFYSDLAKKIPLEDQNSINRRISRKMDTWSQEKKANG